GNRSRTSCAARASRGVAAGRTAWNRRAPTASAAAASTRSSTRTPAAERAARRQTMRVTYVLPYPELNGGNKVIFQHARLLAECGDEVTILGEGPRPDWIAAGTYHDYAAAASPALPPQDLVIATYWTTVATARALALGPVAHFCQGYEGGLEHLEPQRAAIE